MRSPIAIVDVDRCDSWTRYRNGLCDSCQANCCTMPVEVRLPDLVRLDLVDVFEAEHEAPKQIAKRLMKAKLVEHFNFKNNIFTLARRADHDCIFLDATTRRCGFSGSTSLYSTTVGQHWQCTNHKSVC